MINKIKEIREKAGLSQIELAFKIKTSAGTRMAQSNLANIESFRMKPGKRVRKAIAKALKVDEEVLFPCDQITNQTYKDEMIINRACPANCLKDAKKEEREADIQCLKNAIDKFTSFQSAIELLEFRNETINHIGKDLEGS